MIPKAVVEDSFLEVLIVQSRRDENGISKVWSKSIPGTKGRGDRLVVALVFKLRRRKPDGE